MKVGEIIDVTSTSMTAESYELHDSPSFGALVRVRTDLPSQRNTYALCYSIQTGAIEPGRSPVAWGRHDDDSDDVFQQQPQLRSVLRTTFDAVFVGFDYVTSDGGHAVRQRIPPKPPHLHAAVYLASAAEIQAFNTELSYLRFALRSAVPSIDDFIAAVIERAYWDGDGNPLFVQKAARYVARLLGQDHERIMSIMELLEDVHV